MDFKIYPLLLLQLLLAGHWPNEYSIHLWSGRPGFNPMMGKPQEIIWINFKKVKSATTVECNPKAPFSIVTTPRCKGGCYTIFWITQFYSWSLPYNGELALIDLTGNFHKLHGSLKDRVCLVPATRSNLLLSFDSSLTHSIYIYI